MYWPQEVEIYNIERVKEREKKGEEDIEEKSYFGWKIAKRKKLVFYGLKLTWFVWQKIPYFCAILWFINEFSPCVLKSRSLQRSFSGKFLASLSCFLWKLETMAQVNSNKCDDTNSSRTKYMLKMYGTSSDSEEDLDEFKRTSTLSNTFYQSIAESVSAIKKIFYVKKNKKIFYRPKTRERICRINPPLLFFLHPFQDTRTHIVIELYNTEQSYVESLQIIVQKYMNPLKNSDCEVMIDTQIVDDIFYMVPSILNIHEGFLEELKKRLDCWNSNQIIGDAFNNVVRIRQFYYFYNSILYFSRSNFEQFVLICSFPVELSWRFIPILWIIWARQGIPLGIVAPHNHLLQSSWKCRPRSTKENCH